MIKICAECGKEFNASHGRKTYCSKLCKMKSNERARDTRRGAKRKSDETLCWSCKKACGGCSWSRSLEPVKGWEAEAVTNKDFYYETTKSYKVINCPEYEKGR